MDKLFEILAVVAPVVAALFLGWLSRVKKLVSPEGIAGLKALVMNFTLPAVVLGAFYKAEFSRSFVIVTIAMVACCLLALGLGFAVKRLFGLPGKLTPFLNTGYEAGMMGYGLYAMLFGAGQLHHFAMVDLGQVVFVFTLYMALLNRQKGISTRQTLIDMVKAPVFVAIVLGVVIGASGLGQMLDAGPAGPVVAALLSYISAPTGMLMIFVVGYGLQWEKRSAKNALAAAGIRVVVQAGLCAACVFVVGRLVPMPRELFWAFVLMFSLPAPFVLPVFANSPDEDATISTNLSLYALLSVAAFALISVLK